MADDIVTRLRIMANGLCPIAEAQAMLHAAADIERLRADLDAARLEICMLRAPSTGITEQNDAAMREYAGSRGWDLEACAEQEVEPMQEQDP